MALAISLAVSCQAGAEGERMLDRMPRAPVEGVLRYGCFWWW
jgi:hypothetical protein